MRKHCLCKRKYALRALLVAALVLVMASLTACSDSDSSDSYSGGSGEIENAGYVGTDLKDNELKEAIVSGKVTDASDLLYKFPKKKPGSQSEEFDLDHDTLRWLNGAYAIQMEANSMDLSVVGGVYDFNDEDVDAVKRMLKGSWGIKNRKTLAEKVQWLLDGGHREKYSKEGLENISFWDYSRAISILGWGYAVGYITIDEYLYQSIPIGWMIQKDYENWETAGKAYLEGYKHWRDLPAGTNDTEYIMREMAYEMLLENPDSIYNTVDFAYDLKEKTEK